MAMIRCPICGEKFSDTYRHCPFCEEEEALRQGEQIRRNINRGGKRVAHRRQQPSLLSPLLILLILILAALLVYLLYGDKLAATLFGNAEQQQQEEVLDHQEDDGTVTMPEDGQVVDGENGSGDTDTVDLSQVDPSTLPETLTIAYLGSPREEFTMSVGDEPIPLTVSGGTGTYAWSSSDDGIISVDESGKVTAISAGQATLTVTDGTGKGTCEVIVKAGTNSTDTSTGTATSGGSLKAGAAVVVNGGNGVRVRSGPSTNDEVLATIPNGGSVQIVESAGDGWYKITFSGVGGVTTTGYMKGDYLANQ
ncbi:SH3 domain-containing protein [Dysosmobacter sp.]|uniref:SH3 domain-containing protein n=1 Tax=Dysosmobacter sp. TaxID=2591382 RepID=UPI003A9021BB